MTKKLIVAGCSWTEGIFEDNILWSDILAEKLNMECINLGRGGAGNEYIFSAISDKIVEESNIGFVVVMWSECFRLDFDLFNEDWTTLHYTRIGDYVKNWHKSSNAVGVTKRYLRLSYALQNLMQNNNIPYIQIQGIRPVHYIPKKGKESKFVKQFCNTLIDSLYFNKIDNNKFLGWPVMSEIGGTCMEDICKDEIHKDHPNEIGHNRIADFIYETIRY